MNRTLKFICAICPAVVLLGGCDFMRNLAGRPTSARIEQMRSSIHRADSIRQALRKAAIADSLRAVHSADSTAAEAFLKASGTMVKTPSECRLGISFTPSSEEYYVILGSFKSVENAVNFQTILSSSGYGDSIIIPFSNGLMAVAVPVNGDVVRLREALLKIRAESFCPPDAWVLRIPKE